jgi:hypothetical protein
MLLTGSDILLHPVVLTTGSPTNPKKSATIRWMVLTGSEILLHPAVLTKKTPTNQKK